MNLETKITIYKFTPQLFTLTLKMPTSDKVPLQNRYRKIGKIFCNDFRCKSLICRSLTFKCLLVTQLLIIPLQREVITPTVTELN